MNERNAEVIRDQYAAVNERDWKRVMSYYDEDVVLVVPAGIRGGTFTGREEVGDWFGEWMRTFDRNVEFEIAELRELEDGSLLVVADHRFRGPSSGIELETKVVWQVALRDGKIVRLVGFESRDDAFRALDLGE